MCAIVLKDTTIICNKKYIVVTSINVEGTKTHRDTLIKHIQKKGYRNSVLPCHKHSKT